VCFLRMFNAEMPGGAQQVVVIATQGNGGQKIYTAPECELKRGILRTAPASPMPWMRDRFVPTSLVFTNAPVASWHKIAAGGGPGCSLRSLGDLPATGNGDRDEAFVREVVIRPRAYFRMANRRFCAYSQYQIIPRRAPYHLAPSYSE
jgi:hypothetical protein